MSEAECKGCERTVAVRLPEPEVERLLSMHLQANPLHARVDASTHARRLTLCQACPDLRYGTTCRHCGCLVGVRTWVAQKSCAGVPAKW
jgi:hypothetical protein